ncbi:hypothetical protein [Pedomonas mirosovicensis]|uniref:hypothetical protein n=1 Tax=Pedomonas mirosovicensis TaxID=2908641 RepID=UPI002168462E|nr:hypothetical protein [Pedomonas mirosovicensis]MCH8685235.1 hypothetical protein [Pedomonas mirosovicensis]
MKTSGLIGVLSACVLLVGCDSGSEVKQAFMAKYGKDLCLEVAESFPFSITYQNDISEAPESRWALPLVEEGVLTEGEVMESGTPPMVLKTVSFDLSEQGRSFLQDNRLCYGKTEVDRILNTREYGESGKRFLDAQVVLMHVVTAPWAKNPALKGQIKSGREVVERTLRGSEDGWILH